MPYVRMNHTSRINHDDNAERIDGSEFTGAAILRQDGAPIVQAIASDAYRRRVALSVNVRPNPPIILGLSALDAAWLERNCWSLQQLQTISPIATKRSRQDDD